MFQEFIALKDINLDIKKGEAWGFLGTNGAGKSTLLKVVSRILKPASGTVKVSGTVEPESIHSSRLVRIYFSTELCWDIQRHL